jgi:hypothetical protein
VIDCEGKKTHIFDGAEAAVVCFPEPFFFAPDVGATVVVFIEVLALVALVERVEDDASGADSSTCFRWGILGVSVGGSH